MIGCMRHLQIVIVGAGIAGLTAARALQISGIQVRVYEQASQLGEVGAGLTLSPNATHVLNAIGLHGVLAQIGMRPERGGVRHWQTGELMVEIPRGGDMLEKYGAAYFQVHRADLHAALVAAIRAEDPNAIVLGHVFRSLHDDGSRVRLGFANGASVQADLAIGADGLRSTMRTLLFGAEQPHFTGYIAYRGLVPMRSLPPGIIVPTSCLSTGPGRSFTRYLLRQGTLVNYVGLCERDGWREEGWSIRASVDEVLGEYAGWYEDVRTIIRNTPPDGLLKWALFDREPLERWSLGRVALLGDAAHPMLPFLGQGAAMGIEDGLVLARAVAAAGSLDEALQRYVEARQPRTTWVMRESREAARNYHSGRSGNFQPGRHVSAESLGIMAYNPAAVVV